jgi:periplasmic divalent cation tolerance protein
VENTMNNEFCIVVTTYSDEEVGKRLVEGLVSGRLAACIQSIDITSAYHWKGKVNREKETLLLIKTKSSLYNEVEAAIRSVHSYEVPEIVQVPIAGGWEGYLDWLRKECK